eukprot:SAG25_NODE_833_length_5146_cov_2.847434_1_plen_1031_part_00
MPASPVCVAGANAALMIDPTLPTVQMCMICNVGYKPTYTGTVMALKPTEVARAFISAASGAAFACTPLVLCPVGYKQDPTARKCVRCLDGTGSNKFGTACETCKGTTYSVCGVCNECPFPFDAVAGKNGIVGNTDCRQMAAVCPPGEEPAAPQSISSGTPPHAPATCLAAATLTAKTCVKCKLGYAGGGSKCKSCDTALNSVASKDQSECKTCEAGKQPNDDRSNCHACPDGKASPSGHCEICDATAIPNESKTKCKACTGGMVPSQDRRSCECPDGTYDMGRFLPLQCFERDFSQFDKSASDSKCLSCPPCADCTRTNTALRKGYQLFAGAASGVKQSAFKCFPESACREQQLYSATRPRPHCREGHTGLLCATCTANWTHSANMICERCDKKGGAPGIYGYLGMSLVTLVTLILVYMLLRFVFHRRARNAQQKSRNVYQRIFDELDADSSGTVTRTEITRSLSSHHNVDISAETAARIVDAIDLDSSGDVDFFEFEAWLEQAITKPKMAMTVAKIMIGLVQVLRELPRGQRQEGSFPQQWELMQDIPLLAFNVESILPCVEFGYYRKLALNAVVFPITMIAIVHAAWCIQCKQKQADDPGFDADAAKVAAKASKRGDLYMAVFLTYPTVTKAFFDHVFGCRRLSDTLAVQDQDYSVHCYEGATWIIVAILCCLGIVCFSFGVPVVMGLFMRHRMRQMMEKASSGSISKIQAHCDFGREFAYMCGEYTPAAYYAESIDLVRKLMLGGVLAVVKPGTVVQCFYSVIMSFIFIVIHCRIWPYHSLKLNIIKLLADVQIYVIMVVALVLRLHSIAERLGTDSSGNTAPLLAYINDAEGVNLAFYHVVLGVAVGVSVPGILVLATYNSDVDKAQLLLLKAAKLEKDTRVETGEANARALRQVKQTEGSAGASDMKAADPVHTQTHTKQPNPWIKKIDPGSGRPYYANRQTRERSWTQPVGFNGGGEDSGHNRVFSARVDPTSGRQYFVNPATRQSVWHMPPDGRLQESTTVNPVSKQASTTQLEQHSRNSYDL